MSNLSGIYEAGTWTPEITGSTGAPTIAYTTQLGFYTRVGNRVDVKALVVINTISGGTGSLNITNLPYTSANDGVANVGTYQCNSVAFDAGSAYCVSNISSNSNVASVLEVNASAGGTPVLVTDLSNSDNMTINITYWI